MSHSSIEVSPSTAAFFSAITGMPWPKINEGELRDIRDAYERLSKELPELRELIAKVAATCRRQFEGAAAQAFARQMNYFIGVGGDNDYVTAAAEASKKLADCAGDVANAVEYTKWMAIAQLVQLLVEIALAIFWAPFSFGASLSGLVLRKLLTKAALTALMKYLMKTILMHTFAGIVGGLLMDGIIQNVQIGQGNRKEIDKEYTKQAVLFGVIGGLLGGPLELLGLGLGKLLGRLLGKSGGRLLADQLSNYLVHGDLQGLKGLLKAAAEAAEASGKKGPLGAIGKNVLKASEEELLKMTFTKKEAKAFARELGSLMEAATEQLQHGFGKSGAGTLSEIFVNEMETVFGKHLGSGLAEGEARAIGREFGEAFVKHWGATTGERVGGAEMKEGLAHVLENRGLSGRHVTMLSEHLPGLAGNMSPGNLGYRLGGYLGGYLQSGVQNVLTEGFYNLIFGEDHEFSVSAGSFLGGMLTGVMGHVMHLGTEPLMKRYVHWVETTQHQAIADGASDYFPLYHPISFAALASLASGKVVPFPVPRVGHRSDVGFDPSVLHKGDLEDLADAIGHAAGKKFDSPPADPEVAELMQTLLRYADFTTEENSEHTGLAALRFLGDINDTGLHAPPPTPRPTRTSGGDRPAPTHPAADTPTPTRTQSQGHQDVTPAPTPPRRTADNTAPGDGSSPTTPANTATATTGGPGRPAPVPTSSAAGHPTTAPAGTGHLPPATGQHATATAPLAPAPLAPVPTSSAAGHLPAGSEAPRPTGGPDGNPPHDTAAPPLAPPPPPPVPPMPPHRPDPVADGQRSPQRDTAPGATTHLADDLRPAPLPPAGPLPPALRRERWELPDLTPEQRAQRIANLSTADRRLLARDHGFVEALRDTLSTTEFARTAAQLMVHVDPRADRPASARQEAQRQIARLLHDHATIERMLKNGADVVVVPKDVRMTDVPDLRDLRGTRTDSGGGRGYDEVRGAGGRHSAVTEENLLGEHTPVGPAPHYPDGYSTTTHEFGHTLHEYGLDAADRKLVTDVFRDKRARADAWEEFRPGWEEHRRQWQDFTARRAEFERTRRPGDEAAAAQWKEAAAGWEQVHTAWEQAHREHAARAPRWSDGPYADAGGRRNYGARDEQEYFAQVTNAYLGTNHGLDPHTLQPRNNGADWVRKHEPKLLPLLEKLYGRKPAEPDGGPANPVRRTTAENELYEGLREFTDLVENGPAPDTGAPKPPAARPEDGTPEDSTPEDGTPEDGTPEDGTPEDERPAPAKPGPPAAPPVATPPTSPLPQTPGAESPPHTPDFGSLPHTPDLDSLPQTPGVESPPHTPGFDFGPHQPGAEPAPLLQIDHSGLWHRAEHPDGTPAGVLRPRHEDGPGRPRPVTGPNGVVRVHDWTTVPGVRPDSPLALFASNWRRPAHEPGHTYYPEHWDAAEVHVQVRAAELVPLRRVDLPDGGTYWVGESAGVRIEGIRTPDGTLLHRPTPDQPPQPHPYGEGDPQPQRRGYLLPGYPPAGAPHETTWVRETEDHYEHWPIDLDETAGRDLPTSWTPEQIRYAVGRVLADADTAGLVDHGAEDVTVVGEFAGVRIEVTLDYGDITDYRGVPVRVVPETDPLHLMVSPARDGQGFDVHRNDLPDGDRETLITVRVALDTSQLRTVPDRDTRLEQLRQNARDGIDSIYNRGQRLPDGDLLRVRVQFVRPDQDHHIEVTVHPEEMREDMYNWSLETTPTTVAHEIGHQLGLPDEYRESVRRPRPVYLDGLMGGAMREANGRIDIDIDNPHGKHLTENEQAYLQPRNLRQLGNAIDRARHLARQDDADTPPHDPVPDPRTDGDLPTRANFRLTVRQEMLRGSEDGGGHLLPPQGSARHRPVPVPGSEHPNGTYRAHVRRTTGPLGDHTELPRRAAEDTTTPREHDTRAMFPPHWTEDHAVYAAEQAYLDARRNGGVRPSGLGHQWSGVYGGVRIEGELRGDEFVSFRPSDDQSGLTPAPHLPDLGTLRPFDQRVDDLTRYGDRHTLDGVHQRVDPAVARRRGIRIGDPVHTHDNGVHRAPVRFLDPNVRPGSPEARRPSNWHRRADRPDQAFYPDHWNTARIEEAVQEAHRNATAELLPDGRTVRWTGTAHLPGEHLPIRIEGLTRDGRHLAHRPADQQPHRDWRADAVAEVSQPRTVVLPGTGLRVTVRHVRFESGQTGVEITAPVHLAPEHTTPQQREEFLAGFQQYADDHFAGLPGGRDGLVRLRLTAVDDPAAAHATLDLSTATHADFPDLVPHLHQQAGGDLPAHLRTLGGTPPAEGWFRLPSRHPDPQPLQEPVTPGTGHRPTSDTDLSRAATQDFHPEARRRGSSRPRGWTDADLRLAAHQVRTSSTGTVHPDRPRTTVHQGEYDGHRFEVHVRDGLIRSYRHLPDTTVQPHDAVQPHDVEMAEPHHDVDMAEPPQHDVEMTGPPNTSRKPGEEKPELPGPTPAGRWANAENNGLCLLDSLVLSLPHLQGPGGRVAAVERIRARIEEYYSSRPASEYPSDVGNAYHRQADRRTPIPVERLREHVPAEFSVSTQDLHPEDLRSQLAERFFNLDVPLSSSERDSLLHTIRNWRTEWGGDTGEMLLPAAAHALNLNIRVIRHDGSPYPPIGPENGHPVTVYYNGHNHYDGTVPLAEHSLLDILTTHAPTQVTSALDTAGAALRPAGRRPDLVDVAQHYLDQTRPGDLPQDIRSRTRTAIESENNTLLLNTLRRDVSSWADHTPQNREALPAVLAHALGLRLRVRHEGAENEAVEHLGPEHGTPMDLVRRTDGTYELLPPRDLDAERQRAQEQARQAYQDQARQKEAERLKDDEKKLAEQEEADRWAEEEARQEEAIRKEAERLKDDLREPTAEEIARHRAAQREWERRMAEEADQRRAADAEHWAREDARQEKARREEDERLKKDREREIEQENWEEAERLAQEMSFRDEADRRLTEWKQEAERARLRPQDDEHAQELKEKAAREAQEEADRKAKEKAAREAQEEADRKAKEKAAREAQEEADRKAKEKAAREAQEEADRKAKEKAAREAQEEADRKAKEKAAREAQEEADRKAKEKAAREAQEEADRKAKEKAAREAQEEADRKAKEKAAREAQEEADRKAKEEAQKAKDAKAAKEEASKLRVAEMERRPIRGTDLVIELTAGQSAVRDRVKAVLERVSPGDEVAIKAFADAYFGPTALRPMVAALSQGKVWEAPFSSNRWSGKILLGGKVTGREWTGLRAIEFENGVDQRTSTGTRSDGSWQTSVGLQSKQSDSVADVTDMLGYFYDNGHSDVELEIGGPVARSKGTVDADLSLTHLELNLEFGQLKHGGSVVEVTGPKPTEQAGGPGPKAEEDHTAPVRVTVRTAVPYHPPVAPGDKLIAPERLLNGRIGGQDIVQELRPLESTEAHRPGREAVEEMLDQVEQRLKQAVADAAARPGPAGDHEMTDLGGNRPPRDDGAEQVLANWPQLREQIRSQVGFERLERSLRSMTADEPIRVEIEVGPLHRRRTVSVDITAKVEQPDHIGSVKAPEFNIGTTVQQVHSTAKSTGHALQGSLVPSIKSKAVSDNANANIRVGLEHVTIEGSSETSQLSSKSKTDGALFDADVRYDLTFDNGHTVATGPVAKVRLLVDQADTTAPPKEGAEAAAPPKKPLPPQEPSYDVWKDGLREDVVVRDVGNVADLRTKLKSLGTGTHAAFWKEHGEEVLSRAGQSNLAPRLVGMTRGEPLTLFDNGKHVVTAVAKVKELVYRRHDAAAELNQVNENTGFSADRRLLSTTGAVQGQLGGAFHPNSPKPDGDLVASGGKLYRDRFAWRARDADRMYANGKYGAPQAIFGADLTVEFHIKVKGEAGEPLTADLHAEFGLDTRNTEDTKVLPGEDGKVRLTPPEPKEQPPHGKGRKEGEDGNEHKENDGNEEHKEGDGSKEQKEGGDGAKPKSPPPPYLAPTRMRDQRELNASYVVHSLSGADKVAAVVKQKLADKHGTLTVEQKRRVENSFTETGLKTRLAELTLGGSITKKISGKSWTAEVTVTAELGSSTHHSSLAKYEFESGALSSKGQGYAHDELHRLTAGAVGKYKNKLFDVTLGYIWRRDRAQGNVADTIGSVSNRGKHSEPAELFETGVTYRIDIKHTVKHTGLELFHRADHETVRADARVAVPRRDAEKVPAPVEPPQEQPHRLDRDRLDSSAIVTDVHRYRTPEQKRADAAARQQRDAAEGEAPVGPPQPSLGRSVLDQITSWPQEERRTVRVPGQGIAWEGERNRSLPKVHDGVLPEQDAAGTGSRFRKNPFQWSWKEFALTPEGRTGHNPLKWDWEGLVRQDGVVRKVVPVGDPRHVLVVEKNPLRWGWKEFALTPEGRTGHNPLKWDWEGLVRKSERDPGGNPFRSDWKGLDRKLEAALTPEKLQARLKAMTAGDPIVVRHGRSTVRITAVVRNDLRDLGHTGDTEFNASTQVQHGYTNTDGVTAYGEGSGHSVTVGAVGYVVLPSGVTMNVGGSFNGARGTDRIDTVADGFTAGSGTKAKVAGRAFEGVARLQMEFTRKPWVGASVFRRRTADIGFETIVETTETSTPQREATPAPEKPVPGRIHLPPARIEKHGLRDTDVLRWLGDVGGLHDLVRQGAEQYFGSRTWERVRPTVENVVSHSYFSALLHSASQGVPVSTGKPPSHWDLGKGLGMEVKVEVVDLEHQGNHQKAVLSPANNGSAGTEHSELKVRQWGLQAQVGAKLGDDLTPYNPTGTLGLQHQWRNGGSLGDSGGGIANGKYEIPMGRFKGAAKVTVTFFDGSAPTPQDGGGASGPAKAPLAGTLPFTVDIPLEEVSVVQVAEADLPLLDGLHRALADGTADWPTRFAPRTEEELHQQVTAVGLSRTLFGEDSGHVEDGTGPALDASDLGALRTAHALVGLAGGTAEGATALVRRLFGLPEGTGPTAGQLADLVLAVERLSRGGRVTVDGLTRLLRSEEQRIVDALTGGSPHG